MRIGNGTVAVGRCLGIAVVLLILLLVVGRCAGDGGDSSRVARPPAVEPPAPTLPPPTGGEPIDIPSDPQATYTLLEWRRLPNGNREAITRRDGPSGTSFARRELDCGAMTFRYLGEGDTLEEARLDRPSPRMAELVTGSISAAVTEYVCSR